MFDIFCKRYKFIITLSVILLLKTTFYTISYLNTLLWFTQSRKRPNDRFSSENEWTVLLLFFYRLRLYDRDLIEPGFFFSPYLLFLTLFTF